LVFAQEKGLSPGSMRRFFVTGGAGFIGSAFVRLLLDEIPSCEVTTFDALTYAGNLDNLAGVDQARHHFVRGNIADSQIVLDAFDSNTDAIINFAAESHVDRSIVSAYEFLRTNVLAHRVCWTPRARRTCADSFRFRQTKLWEVCRKMRMRILRRIRPSLLTVPTPHQRQQRSIWCVPPNIPLAWTR